MATSKILTNERFFVILGGSLGFLLCWAIAVGTGQGAQSAFEKATMGCVAGGGVMFLFARVLQSILKTLRRERVKQNEEAADKAHE